MRYAMLLGTSLGFVYAVLAYKIDGMDATCPKQIQLGVSANYPLSGSLT